MPLGAVFFVLGWFFGLHRVFYILAAKVAKKAIFRRFFSVLFTNIFSTFQRLKFRGIEAGGLFHQLGGKDSALFSICAPFLGFLAALGAAVWSGLKSIFCASFYVDKLRTAVKVANAYFLHNVQQAARPPMSDSIGAFARKSGRLTSKQIILNTQQRLLLSVWPAQIAALRLWV